MVILELKNASGVMKNLEDAKLWRELDFTLSYQIPNFKFMNVSSKWDGRYRLLKKNGEFPIGLASTIEDSLKKRNIPYEIIDKRSVIPRKPLSFKPGTKFAPRDYQIEAKNTALAVGSGILKLPTGAGKSLLIAMITGEYNCKTVIYVIGIDLLYQMKKTIEEAFGIECGMVGNGHCDIKQITVATIWSAEAAFNKETKLYDSDMNADSAAKNKNLNKAAIRKMVNDAELIFVDECQFCGSSSMQHLHQVSASARHRFLLSGTPWRESGDDLLIEAISGPKIFDLTASELVKRKWLVTPKIHFVEVPELKNAGENYQKVYQNYIVKNDVRNNKILNAARKLVDAGRKVLILVVKIEHGRELFKILSPELKVQNLDGSNNIQERIDAISQLKTGEIDVLIASKIFDQGIDVPEIDAAIIAGSGKSQGRAIQRIGRVIRPFGDKKKDAIIIDFYDNCKYLKEHSRSRYKIYKTEPEFKIKLPDGKKL